MADEQTTEQPADGQAQPADEKGLPPGVTKADLDEGQSRTAGAPAAPEIPQKPQTEEEPKGEEGEDDPAKAEDEKAKEQEDDKAQDENQEDEDTLEFPVYNDETADSVVAMLKEAGVTPKEADEYFREAVESGDLSKVDQAALAEKVGKEKANLIMIGVKDYYNRQVVSVQESIKAVHDTMGGEKNWETVRDWAQKQANNDPEFAAKIAELNKMFDISKHAAMLAAKELRTMYESDRGNKSLTVKMTQGDPSSKVGPGEKPLSRSDYLEKVKAAHDKNDMAEVQRLRQARAAAKAAGY